MSSHLYEFAKQFAMKLVSADDFADEFTRRWKEERDALKLTEDPAEMSERLSSVFCLADLYNPDSNRKDYELDEIQLRDKVKTMIGL
jgi:hypothetical protein